jgi:hypothetical protein
MPSAGLIPHFPASRTATYGAAFPGGTQSIEAFIRYRRGHACMTKDLRATNLYELRHFRKMWRDTSVELRSELPRWWSFVPRRLIGICTPAWLRSIGRIIRLRYRLRLFRQWLRQRTVVTSPHRSR